MSKRDHSISTKTARLLALFLVLALPLAMVANGQKPKCKKWTYDFSEVVKYSETPLEACKNYVKEKYPNDNYKPSVEATNDPETYRCSASETYIGVVYMRECESCCKSPTQVRKQSQALSALDNTQVDVSAGPGVLERLTPHAVLQGMLDGALCFRIDPNCVLLRKEAGDEVESKDSSILGAIR